MSDPTQGQQSQSSGTSQFNAMSFMVQQMISRVNVATLVVVQACTNSGGVSPVGTVDVQILVNQVDGAGKAVPHVTVYGLPYLRLQGGANAVILDPQPGDIGVAVFAHSDLSAVKATKAQANPGSARRNSIADGMYLGGMINGVPTQYVQFSDDGIKLLSPTRIDLVAPIVNVTASASMTVQTAALDLEASATATMNSPANSIAGGATVIDGKNFLGHHHFSAVGTGISQTGNIA